MKPTTRKRMPALTPDEARCLKMVSKLTTRMPARKRTGWNDTPFQQDEEREAEMRSGVKRTLKPWPVLLKECRRIKKLTRLIARWRKEAVKAEANSIDTGLRWINVQALCIRKCADELERLLKP